VGRHAGAGHGFFAGAVVVVVLAVVVGAVGLAGCTVVLGTTFGVVFGTALVVVVGTTLVVVVGTTLAEGVGVGGECGLPPRW